MRSCSGLALFTIVSTRQLFARCPNRSCVCLTGNMGKEVEVKKSAKEKRQEKARLKAGAVAKKEKTVEVDEVGEVGPIDEMRRCTLQQRARRDLRAPGLAPVSLLGCFVYLGVWRSASPV